MRRIAAIAAVVGALALGACGSDDETTSPATSEGQATTETSTSTVAATTTTAQTPTAPESAGDTSGAAPDAGIGDRPGGPEESGSGY